MSMIEIFQMLKLIFNSEWLQKVEGIHLVQFDFIMNIISDFIFPFLCMKMCSYRRKETF